MRRTIMVIDIYPRIGLPLFPDVLSQVLGEKHISVPQRGNTPLCHINDVVRTGLPAAHQECVVRGIVAKVALMLRGKRVRKQLAGLKAHVPDSTLPRDLDLAERAFMFLQSRGFFDARGAWRHATLERLAQLDDIGAKYFLAYLLAAEKAGRQPTIESQRQERYLFLEDELAAWVSESIYAPRRAQALTMVCGLDGGGARSLKSIGETFGVSRERARQLVAEAKTLAPRSRTSTPGYNLRRAIAAVSASLPCTPEQAARALAEARISRNPFDVGGLKATADLFQSTCSFGITSIDGVGVVATQGQRRSIERAQQEARRIAGRLGIVHTQHLQRKLAKDGSAASAPTVTFAVSLIRAASWLDAERQWFWLPEGYKRNPVVLRLRKVVDYVGEVDVGDLEGALTTTTSTVPRHVILEFCRQAGLEVDGSRVRSPTPGSASVPKVERQMADVLRAAGGTLARGEFSRLCASRGIARPTFFVYLRHSPLFVIDAKRRCTLRGAGGTPQRQAA